MHRRDGECCIAVKRIRRVLTPLKTPVILSVGRFLAGIERSSCYGYRYKQLTNGREENIDSCFDIVVAFNYFPHTFERSKVCKTRRLLIRSGCIAVFLP